MNVSVAWLSQGQIKLKEGSGEPRKIESVYGQTLRDRAIKSAQRHAWKAQGAGSGFFSGSVVWGKAGLEQDGIPIHITSLCRGKDGGQFYYTLESESLCGILAVEKFGTEERRLWNNNQVRVSFLNVSAESGDIVCASEQKMGASNIAVMLAEGGGVGEVTEGDSVDTAPRWIPGAGRKVVFQSAGVGRNKHGHFAGLGPFSIQRLDLDSGEMETLLEDPAYDFVAPQFDAKGNLYCIRRPHRTGREVTILGSLKDLFLMPVRLLRAIFGWINIFSILYGGKPLTPAGGAKGKPMDLKKMMIWGNIVSSQQATDPREESPGLVPRSWQLIRLKLGADPEVMAKGVLAFDLASDGSVLFTNGNTIQLLTPDGKTSLIARDEMVEQVAVLSQVAPAAE